METPKFIDNQISTDTCTCVVFMGEKGKKIKTPAQIGTNVR
jgi:hypothetical protein